MIHNLVWTREKYGRVHVKYGKPISLRERLADFVSLHNVDPKVYFSRTNIGQTPQEVEAVGKLKREFSRELSLDLVYSLSDNMVVMSTQMVASMLLMKRHGGVKEEELLTKVSWLFGEI